jgi:hypothetical protein
MNSAPDYMSEPYIQSLSLVLWNHVICHNDALSPSVWRLKIISLVTMRQSVSYSVHRRRVSFLNILLNPALAHQTWPPSSTLSGGRLQGHNQFARALHARSLSLRSLSSGMSCLESLSGLNSSRFVAPSNYPGTPPPGPPCCDSSLEQLWPIYLDNVTHQHR